MYTSFNPVSVWWPLSTVPPPSRWKAVKAPGGATCTFGPHHGSAEAGEVAKEARVACGQRRQGESSSELVIKFWKLLGRREVEAIERLGAGVEGAGLGRIRLAELPREAAAESHPAKGQVPHQPVSQQGSRQRRWYAQQGTGTTGHSGEVQSPHRVRSIDKHGELCKLRREKAAFCKLACEDAARIGLCAKDLKLVMKYRGETRLEVRPGPTRRRDRPHGVVYNESYVVRIEEFRGVLAKESSRQRWNILEIGEANPDNPLFRIKDNIFSEAGIGFI